MLHFISSHGKHTFLVLKLMFLDGKFMFRDEKYIILHCKITIYSRIHQINRQKSIQNTTDSVQNLFFPNSLNPRHLNQNQANIIEAFLAFDGSDRTQLCEEIWNVASPKVDYYWRDGTFDALEELRTKELYNRKYGNGRSI